MENMMNRTICISGTGIANQAPDQIILYISFEVINKNYEKLIEETTIAINSLNKQIEHVGFSKSDLKNTLFNISTEYENRRKSNGDYERIFKGYKTTNKFTIYFDLNLKYLSSLIYSISQCIISPELSIDFTIKDTTAIKDELLISATNDAAKKAEILAKSTGASLGKILNINYKFDEYSTISKTRYNFNDTYQIHASIVDITPEEINLSESVSFIWELI